MHHDRLKACNDREHPVWLLRMRSDLLLSLDIPNTNIPEELDQPQDLDGGVTTLHEDGVGTDPDLCELPGELEEEPDNVLGEIGELEEGLEEPLRELELGGAVPPIRTRTKPAWLSDYVWNRSPRN